MTAKEKGEQLIRLSEVGSYLRSLREEKGITLNELGESLKVSVPYLSELERGFKMPSDKLIFELAHFFQLDIEDLFNRFGKVSATAADELEQNPNLQKTVAQIARDKRLTEDQKQALYDEFFNVYHTFLREIGKENGDE
ncbi:helix-turn-helix transcriptional regulator [Heliobacterium chlorum]|uniref:Helix-turn-helix transcriptional regulator n=2 Tax=Heliobacterium chlorum TaxID=2698 RepID=A0ABR7T6Y0_HELCL|nr:helix-turn-helix transcriptional regulator [Heliobacterium chlorum]